MDVLEKLIAMRRFLKSLRISSSSETKFQRAKAVSELSFIEKCDKILASNEVMWKRFPSYYFELSKLVIPTEIMEMLKKDTELLDGKVLLDES